MQKRYQYILFVLLLLIVYEVYLIVLYKYKDFQINSYITQVVQDNTQIDADIQSKKDYLAYVQTNAFLDYMAKSSQNKKNPSEDVTFFVSPEQVDEYKKIDTSKQIIGDAGAEVRSKTYGMTNPERWVYAIFHVDLRND